MKKICFYAVATHLGGGERSTLELVTGLRDHPDWGYEPWVLLPREGGPLADELRERGISHEVLPMRSSVLQISRARPWRAALGLVAAGPSLSAYLEQARAVLARRETSLIHTHAIKCHFLGAIMGRRAGIPVLWHLRDILPRGPVRTGLKALSLWGKPWLVANSRATADAFGGGTRIVHNGLDPRQYWTGKSDLFRREFGVPTGAPVVGMVGVFARWKGQLEFLEACKLIAGRFPDARFAVVGGEIYDTRGEEGYAASVRRRANELGIADRVIFTGHRNDIAEIMRGLDILVHASIKPEPFGRVVIEAMACGVSVVAAADGGILEIVEGGRTGLLYPPGDVPALAQAVSGLLESPVQRERLSRAGQDEFRSRFTWDRSLEGIVRIYDEALRASR